VTSDMGEMFNELRDLSKAKRAENRVASAKILSEKGLDFYTRNDGAHLIVSHESGTVDFWPGTGLWKVRGGKRGRGVFKLLKHLGVPT
jgi:hypothetical protein